MRSTRVRVTALFALVLLAGVLAFLYTRPSEQGALPVDTSLVGTVVPDFHAHTLAGTEVSLASLRGRVVVLSFFASWCGPCRVEAPNLVSFAWRARRSAAATTVLGVVFSDSNSAAASFARAAGLTYPILEDPGGQIANDFGVDALPVTVVIDASGRIAEVLQGDATTVQLVDAAAQASRRSA